MFSISFPQRVPIVISAYLPDKVRIEIKEVYKYSGGDYILCTTSLFCYHASTNVSLMFGYF